MPTYRIFGGGRRIGKTVNDALLHSKNPIRIYVKKKPKSESDHLAVARAEDKRARKAAKLTRDAAVSATRYHPAIWY